MRNIILARLGRLFEITGHPYVANVGDAYSYTFGTTGGTAPIAWTCTSLGTSGLTFSAGTLSGTCANGGAFPFTLTARDSNRQFATADFELIIIGTQVFVMCIEGSPNIPMQVEAADTEMGLQ